MYKRDFIWNSLAGLLNASEAVIMSMIVTRTTGLADAGILTIAFAIGNLLMTVGKFGVRNFQVTDVRVKYSYEVYLCTRIVTSVIMLILSVMYVIYKYFVADEYLYKEGCILAICLIYVIETFEDVIWGEFQRRKRLDFGAKLFILRWIAILIMFSITIFKSRNMLSALWICMFVSSLIFLFTALLFEKKYNNSTNEEDKFYIWKIVADLKQITSLIKEVFPLFLATFMTFYINNSPKYALDLYVSSSEQACFGFVSMPVFVIGLLNGMLYQPSMVWLSEQWEKKNISVFRKKIKKQCILVVCISLICIIGAGTIGIPVLSIIYGTDLAEYRMELIVLQFAGMYLALSGYLSIILTIMRRQTLLMYGYILVFALSMTGMKYAAAKYGTIGVSYYYLICLVILCMLYFCIYFKTIKENSTK